MTLRVFSGTAHPALADAVAAALRLPLSQCEVGRFPDGEAHVRLLESVRGTDVYLLQPTSPPADAHLMELLLLADACRRAGAARITAVMPYFGYARQDRRAGGRDSVAARVVADVLVTAGIQHVVAVDLHSASLEGFFSVTLDHLTAVPLLADAMRPLATQDCVVVAPDIGATKLAERYAAMWNLPVAIVHKARVSGTEVRAMRVTGDVRERKPIIVDDMVSTGGTLAEAARVLLEHGARPAPLLVASHLLSAHMAADRLASVSAHALISTDSVADLDDAERLRIRRVTLAPLLAEAVQRLHDGRSLDEMLAHH